MSTIQVRVDDDLKSKADALFKELGTDTTSAIRMFLTQAVAYDGIPFEIKIPNDETLEAIKDARANKNMTKVSLEDLKKDLGA